MELVKGERETQVKENPTQLGYALIGRYRTIITMEKKIR